MAKQDIKHEKGKFKVRGKGGRDITLEFVNSSHADQHIVEELTDADLLAKHPNLPSTWQGQTINWFVNFNVHKKNEKGEKAGYANVEYYITLNLESGKSLLFYYGGQIHDTTDEFRRNGRVKLSAGDPPGGYVP